LGASVGGGFPPVIELKKLDSSLEATESNEVAERSAAVAASVASLMLMLTLLETSRTIDSIAEGVVPTVDIL